MNDKLKFSVPMELSKYYEKVILDLKEVFETQNFVDGKYVQKLEETLSQKYKREVVAVSNGTSGLITSLDSFLNNKKEVIVPSLSFPATIQPIIHAGAIPVFADVSEEDWNLNPTEVEKKINNKTGAIIPVNLFGMPCDINAFKKIKEKYNIPIIYDSCQAFGAKTNYGEVGTFGDAEVFSLDATKSFSGGFGGFVTLEDKNFSKKIRRAKNFGNDENKITKQRGLNARMSEFNAILSLYHFNDFEKNMKMLRGNAIDYRNLLSNIDKIKLQQENENIQAPQYFGIFLDNQDSKIAYKIKTALDKKGIETRIYNPANLHQNYIFIKENITLPITEKMDSKILCLPNHKDVNQYHKNTIKKVLEEIL
jgi:dTDP-4-amino-4,6-dideoxygalactose transaminase